MGDRFKAGQRVRSRKTEEVGTVIGRESPPEGVQPITGTESYTVQWDAGPKEPLVHPDELVLIEGGQGGNEPKGHYRTIGKNRFWCEPKKTSGVQDEVPPGRRYDSKGPKPPHPQPGLD